MTTADAEFGVALARRVASRTGIRRHAGRARSIGNVGRAAVGFGQAVGRSQQTRPVVTADSLTSSRLRPPPGWWHTLAAGDEEPDIAARPSSWTDDLVPVTRHARRAASPTATPSTARPGQPVNGAKATATAPPAPTALAPAPAGGNRLDALRAMIAGGVAPDGSAISPDVLQQQNPDADVPVERVAARRTLQRQVTATTPPEEASATPGRAGRSQGTEAGPSTGPGALGRRSQPETVAPGTTAQRVPGGIGSERHRASAVAPDPRRRPEPGTG